MRIEEKSNKKLLVEGNDDQHVIWALCKCKDKEFNIPKEKEFDVIDCEGINELYKEIPVRLKQSNIETLGIIIDADTDINNRWINIKNIFLKQGFHIPDDLPSTGLVLSNDDIKIGVWIMPNNNINGMLEDFISFLIPEDDKLLPIVRTTLNDIESKKLNNYSSIHRSKAEIHSWLAWQKEPGTPMGFSITKRYLTTDNESCKQLINWLKELFID